MSLSLRAKTMLIAVGALLMAVLGLSLIMAAALAALKNRLVADAVRLAEEQVELLRDDVRDILTRQTDKDARTRSLGERFRIFLRDHNEIVGVIIIDESGHEIVQRGHSPLPDIEIRREPIPDEILKPIEIGERRMGDLRATLSHSRILRRIENNSRMITTYLVIFLGAMVLVLAVLFFLLWRIFRRHIELTRRQEQIDRMTYVGTLASGLAHEIRNPLNAIGLNLQIIGEDVDDPQPGSQERIRSLSSLLRSQVDQLNTTLTRFLTFALPRGPKAEPFDLRALVREARELLEPEFQSREVQGEEDMPRPVWVRGEPAAFHEVVVNILLNALKAMEEQPGERRLRVALDIDEDGGFLTIDDTGPGIPPAELRKIFEVFYTTRDGGSGFGLAIARRIVEDHGGVISAENLPRGGARFTIRIPGAATTPESLGPAKGETASATGRPSAPVERG